MTTSTETKARFGHHPDPAIDFCIEVEVIEGEVENHRIGFMVETPPRQELEARIERALDFRVGGDIGAINAKGLLREIAERFARAKVTPRPRKITGRSALRVDDVTRPE